MVRTLLSVIGLLLIGAASAFAQPPAVDEILAQLRAAAADAAAAKVRFRQEFTLRALFFTWRFAVDVTQEGGAYEVRVGPGAPSFMPDTLPADLVRVAEAIDTFVFSFVGEERTPDGKLYYILDGVPQKSQGGAQSGRLWIDADAWYIAKAHLAYTWGRLEVEQEYRLEAGRRVLHRQSAVARPLGARLEVEYVDYWFPEA